MKHEGCGGRWIMIWSNFRWGVQTTRYVFECNRCWEQGYASSR